MRTFWGACEALFTPRPLGPLYDIVQQAQTPLRAALESDASRATLFAAVLDELTHDTTPTIVVVEDIHWADEATLDLIKYIGRRIQQTAMLLILTWRDDELIQDHPLRLVLGDLPTRAVTRLRLLALSEGAVAAMAQQVQRPAGRLYTITGGNPFFLVETLANDAPGAPASVSDAVLARTARRSLAARRLLELVAVVPPRIEPLGLIEVLDARDEGALDECLAARMLRLDGQTLAFRHTRPSGGRGRALACAEQALHAAILHALLERGVEQTPLARLVHHATQAEDPAFVLRIAPQAAEQAAAQGAHREAVAHYRTALRYADELAPERRAELLDRLANDLYLSGRTEEAIAPCEAALALWRALDRTEEIGRILRRLSRLSWSRGKNVEAEAHGLAAVTALETLPARRELALAYGNLAHLGTRSTDSAKALYWGERAIALATGSAITRR